MRIFIDQPTATENAKTKKKLLRLNVLWYDPDDRERVFFAPGVLVAGGLIYMPSYKWGAVNVPSLFLGPADASDLYDEIAKLAPDFPEHFPLQPRELVVQALYPSAQTLVQKFPGYVRAGE